MPTYQFLYEKLRGQAFRLTVFTSSNIMAIYHLNVRYCSKSKGQSATAKNDYINRNDKYSKRLDDLQISGFGNMPKFAENDPQKFWQASDIYERANARVCTEIVFALPRELNVEQQQELVRSFINNTVNSERNKLPYSFAIHNDKDGNNPHCHLIFSERQLDGIDRTEQQFFKRANSKNAELGGAKKTADFRDREFILAVRKTWREQANQALEKHGHAARIDERSYAEQGETKQPRTRLDRVTWQELHRLERENHVIEQDIARTGQEIAKEVPQHEFEKWILNEFAPIEEKIEKFKGWLKAYEERYYDSKASMERVQNSKGQGFLGLKSSDQRRWIKEYKAEMEQHADSYHQTKDQINALESDLRALEQRKAKFLDKYPHLRDVPTKTLVEREKERQQRAWEEHIRVKSTIRLKTPSQSIKNDSQQIKM